MHVCTAVSKGELARARLLADSLAHYQPDARFIALVVDDVASATGDEPYETLRPELLGVEGLEPLYRACGPGTLGLALRPWLLSHLRERTGDSPVVWMRPDARAFAPLDELAGLCEAHGVVATPGAERLIAIGDGQPVRELLRDWTRRVIDGLARLDGELDSLVLARELARLRDAFPANGDVGPALRQPPDELLDDAELLTGPGWAADAGVLAAAAAGDKRRRQRPCRRRDAAADRCRGAVEQRRRDRGRARRALRRRARAPRPFEA